MDATNKTEIGQRISQLRKRRGITVNKLAYKAGISQSYLRLIELGKTQPTIEYLQYICDALNVPISEFFASEETEDRLASVLCRLNDEQKHVLCDFIEQMLGVEVDIETHR